jgi:hypothetical protein
MHLFVYHESEQPFGEVSGQFIFFEVFAYANAVLNAM